MTALDIDQLRRVLGSGEQPSEGAAPGEGQRRAAVAAVVRQPLARPASAIEVVEAKVVEAEVLFIRRAEHQRDPWSGHMAFPGGRHDPEDPSLFATAIRETSEEVGLDLKRDARLLGSLEPIEAVARGRRVGMTIAPFVFELQGAPELTPNEEVAETLWAPLGPLFRGERDTQKAYEHEGHTSQFPGYDVEGRVVWGEMLQILRRLIYEPTPPGGGKESTPYPNPTTRRMLGAGWGGEAGTKPSRGSSLRF